MTSEKEICVTSFCINCGEVVRYECDLSDPRLNNEPCTTCLPLLAKIAHSEIAEDYTKEASDAITDMLPPQVKRAKKTSTKLEIEEIRKGRKLAIKELRDRRMKVHSKLGRLAKAQ
jgi:hypothetical protein